MKPQLSILIPTKDRPHLIGACLRSLLQTVNRPEVEILLADTGSLDADVFAAYEKTGKEFRGRFEVIEMKRYHFSENNNALAAKAGGEVLVLLNNDTIALPDWEKELVRYALQPGIGAVGAMLLYPDETLQHAGMEFVRQGEHRFVGYHPFRKRRRTLPDASFDRFVPAVTGACLAVRRETYQHFGGLDPAYRQEAQDADFCLKLARAGLKNVYSANSVLYHVENGTRQVSEEPADRKLFRSRWRSFLTQKVFSTRHQSQPVDTAQARQKESARQILFERRGARGDVFASTALLAAYKAKFPTSHLTLKTAFPELADGLPFLDRVLDFNDLDDYQYDERQVLTYEDGNWKSHPHTFLREMARGIGLAATDFTDENQLRPRFAFTAGEEALRGFYREYAVQSPYVVIATGAGWPEKEWTPAGWEALVGRLRARGLRTVQMGSADDQWVEAADLHLFDRALHENLAIVENAAALVTLESFPYHVGAAARTPTLLLTCKTCSNTTELFSNVVELRNRWADATPRPACRALGCRQKSGIGTGDPCATPILKSLSSEYVWEALAALLEKPTQQEAQ